MMGSSLRALERELLLADDEVAAVENLRHDVHAVLHLEVDQARRVVDVYKRQ